MEHHPPIVRKATKEDIPRIIKLLGDFYNEGFGGIENAQFDFNSVRVSMTVKMLVESYQGDIFVYIPEGKWSQIEGLMGVVVEESIISSIRSATELFIWVTPEYRSIHVWNVLLDSVIAWADENRCTNVRLTSQIIEHLKPKQMDRLYKLKQFKPVETIYSRVL